MHDKHTQLFIRNDDAFVLVLLSKRCMHQHTLCHMATLSVFNAVCIYTISRLPILSLCVWHRGNDKMNVTADWCSVLE